MLGTELGMSSFAEEAAVIVAGITHRRTTPMTLSFLSMRDVKEEHEAAMGSEGRRPVSPDSQ